jgi:capsular exopolysaccharide synthesis family protein
MSKIYEALLRAELDRSNRNGNGVPALSSESVSTAKILASLAHSFAPPSPIANPRFAVPPDNAAPFSPPADAAKAASGKTEADRRKTAEAKPPGALSGQISVKTWHPSYKQLPALLERGSEVEQFRSLRSRMHEFRDLNSLKSLMISSGLPQEGKSFVAMNLAISFARHKGGRVLLIDGDMRRSSLHKMLGCTNEPGLTEYLSGKNTLLEVMQRGRAEDGETLHPGLASLTFIAGGTEPEHAADLSGNSRFRELIETVSPLFDWILVDTPPVNLVADGVNLARSCDGVLLIARGGVTKYEVAQRALSELKASKVLGFVLNAVAKPPVSGGYYGYDSYDA